MNAVSTQVRPAARRPWRLIAVVVLAAASSATAATVYVDARATHQPADGWSWASAFTNVQAGLDAAQPGDEVWVAGATYPENLTLAGGRSVYGGFSGIETERTQRDWTSNPTILDGRQLGSVVQVEGEARLDGFTVRNGTADYGGGVQCQAGSAVVISHCVLRDNTGRLGGGGLWATNAALTVLDCRVQGNRAQGNGGGLSLMSSTLWLADSVITSNQAAPNGRGGGLYVGRSGEDGASTSDATVVRNQFTHNWAAWAGGGLDWDAATRGTVASNLVAHNVAVDIGAGMECYASSPAIHHNRFIGNAPTNSADMFGGGGLFIYAGATPCEPVVHDNIFQWNQVTGANQGGGAIYVGKGCSPLIGNNTFIANHATRRAGGIWSESTSAVIANNLFAHGSSSLSVANAANAFNNCFFGNTDQYLSGGAPPSYPNSLVADPGFTEDVRYGDIHLRPDSPCRDAGDPSIVGADWVDLDGEPRLREGRVDIGADTVGGGLPPAVVPIVVRVSLAGSDDQDGLTWERAKRTVQAGLEAASLVGGEVWVAEGLYSERLRLPPFVRLYGGFGGTESSLAERDWGRHATVLDAGRKGCVATALSLGPWSGIDGFTLRDGSSPRGGGLFCMNTALTVANNLVVSNQATFTSTSLPAAGGGGGLMLITCDAVITNNTIAFNVAEHGGGIASHTYGLAQVLNNHIVSNRAAHRFSGSAGGGGLYSSCSSLTVANNLIVGNVATNLGSRAGGGGGILCVNTPGPSIVNNTIVGNFAANGGTVLSEQGGGLYWNATGGGIANNVIAFNSSGVRAGSSAGITDVPPLTNNCVFGNSVSNYLAIADPTGTDGNLSDDPRFVELGFNWRLGTDSPCADAGSRLVVQGDWVDLDGCSRIAGTTVDLGAYEINSCPPFTLRLSAGGPTSAWSLQLSGETGRRYVVECSPDLAQWSAVATNVATNGLAVVVDPSPSGGAGYYRAVTAP